MRLFTGGERLDYAVNIVQFHEVEAGVLPWSIENARHDTVVVRHVVCDYHYLSLHGSRYILDLSLRRPYHWTARTVAAPNNMLISIRTTIALALAVIRVSLRPCRIPLAC